MRSPTLRDVLISSLLAEWLEARMGRPFEWGACDCTTFVLEWLQAVTGDATIEDVRGRYHTEAEALAFHAAYGRGLLEVVAGAGSWVMPFASAVAGDVILARTARDPWWRGHVCTGSGIAAPYPERGVAVIPLALMRGPSAGREVIVVRLRPNLEAPCLP